MIEHGKLWKYWADFFLNDRHGPFSINDLLFLSRGSIKLELASSRPCTYERVFEPAKIAGGEKSKGIHLCKLFSGEMQPWGFGPKEHQILAISG